MANQQLGFEVVGKSNASEVMGKAGKEADKLAKKLKDAFDIKGALTGAFIGAFGAAALLDKAINTITESFKGMADVADKSAKAGISAGEFDALAFAASDASVSTATLSKAIRDLRFNLKDALTDTTKMHNLTVALGFTEEEVRSGKVKSIDVFKRVAIAIGQATTDQEKLNIVTSFFGDKVANDILPVLEAIAKNPNIFDGLVIGSEEAYKAADELDGKMAKTWHNIKNYVAIGTLAIIEQIGKQKDAYQSFFSWLWEHSPTGFVAGKLGIENPFKSSSEQATSPAQATAAKVNARELRTASQNAVKNDNTIANSLGASMGNGPTSGVIGVGNNAQFTLMEQQLDTLKAIKEGIDSLKPANVSPTDFTKQSAYAI